MDQSEDEWYLIAFFLYKHQQSQSSVIIILNKRSEKISEHFPVYNISGLRSRTYTVKLKCDIYFDYILVISQPNQISKDGTLKVTPESDVF